MGVVSIVALSFKAINLIVLNGYLLKISILKPHINSPGLKANYWVLKSEMFTLTSHLTLTSLCDFYQTIATRGFIYKSGDVKFRY